MPRLHLRGPPAGLRLAKAAHLHTRGLQGHAEARGREGRCVRHRCSCPPEARQLVVGQETGGLVK